MAKTAKPVRTGDKGVDSIRPVIEGQTKNGTKKNVRTSTAGQATTGMKGGMTRRRVNARSR